MSSLYLFKNIQTIHTSEQLIDIVLSKTQRKTPTEVHPKYAISRIRGFYMRKVKFCAETFKEKLNAILDQFPKLSDIHPFFADLLNVLYDKDHYKIALGQISVVRNIVEKIAGDYVKLMKFSDSLFRCKQLKIAAFGRMCTAVKKIASSLQYLEEVRKHLGRLPSIDPFVPTVLFFGCPNVGKSSFINQITRANVEISPMPFSTQNLFVGHTLFKNVKIQCIDSPGVLDRPLDQRNTIEMQSLTALAHLKSLILFILDVSESCGNSLEEQIRLYENLKPLFKDKPVVVALNKVDLCPLEEIGEKNQILIEQMKNENPTVKFTQLSAQNPELCENVKGLICQALLDFRMKTRQANKSLKTDEDYYQGVQLIQPTKITKQRQVFIPQSVIEERKLTEKPKKTTLKDYQEEFGGAGVFNYPWNEHFILENDAWKYDIVPEIMDGKNIIDYVDPDIEEKLRLLEEEHAQMQIPDEELLNEEEIEEKDELENVRDKIYQEKIQTELHGKKRLSKEKFSVERMKERLQQKGKNSDKAIERMQKKMERKREQRLKNKNSGMEIEEDKPERKSVRQQWNDPTNEVEQRRRKIQKKVMRRGQTGDADRRVDVKKPKHLFSGKIGRGTRDRR